MDREDWWATVQWVTKSQTQLSTSMNGGFPSGPVVKNPPAKAEDTGLISDLGTAYKLQSNKAHVPQLFSPLGLALGSPIFPSGCEGKLGVALESLQGRRDLT